MSDSDKELPTDQLWTQETPYVGMSGGPSVTGAAYGTRGLENRMWNPWTGVPRRGRLIAYLLAALVAVPFALVWALGATWTVEFGVVFTMVTLLGYRLCVVIFAQLIAFVTAIRSRK